MTIPDFQTLMLPLLRHLADGKEKTIQETVDALTIEFGLTPEEVGQLLPSGKTTVFRNRIAWAKSHFKQAGLLESPRRGVHQISKRGRDLLRTNPKRIDMKLLEQFPEYSRFRSSSRKGETVSEKAIVETKMTPEEHMALGYQQLLQTLADELLRKVMECPPEFFEQLVIELLVAMGYGGSRQDAGKAVGRSGDGGIDGIIKEDRLGLDTIFIQAKKWEGVVGRPEIQKFAGALQGQRARKGVFITTSTFTKEALQFAGVIDSKIVLIDGEQLAALMIDHNIGVTPVSSYTVKRLDLDYFGQE